MQVLFLTSLILSTSQLNFWSADKKSSSFKKNFDFFLTLFFLILLGSCLNKNNTLDHKVLKVFWLLLIPVYKYYFIKTEVLPHCSHDKRAGCYRYGGGVVGLPVIRANFLNIGNIHNQESTDAEIDKYKDSSHVKPHPEKTS